MQIIAPSAATIRPAENASAVTALDTPSKIFGGRSTNRSSRWRQSWNSLHTATLVHDDIIDGAEIAPRPQAVSSQWGSDPRRARWATWLYVSL
ncbi:MAG: polyprenyl synthetase family protein [Acidobacteria bacterium]|nr:polyprenyl synthetase family protein [Acidobacteriota bacterium]